MGRYRYLGVYIRDESILPKVKEIAASMGVSVSELVNAFFRALIEGQDKIRVDLRRAQINIGALTVNIVKQEIQRNTDIDLRVALRELEQLLSLALRNQNIAKTRALVSEALQVVKKLKKQL